MFLLYQCDTNIKKGYVLLQEKATNTAFADYSIFSFPIHHFIKIILEKVLSSDNQDTKKDPITTRLSYIKKFSVAVLR